MSEQKLNKCEILSRWINNLPPGLGYPVVIALLFGMACLYTFVYGAVAHLALAIREFIIGLF